MGHVELSARNVMRQDVTTVRADASIVTAARLMRDMDVHFVPVIDGEGTAIGVITAHDIVIRVVANGKTTPRVRDVMTPEVIHCASDTPVERLCRLMREHRITRVVVLDAARKPIGIVSLSDLAQYEPAPTTGRLFRRITQRKYAPERP